MDTLVRIDKRTKEAKLFLAYIKTLPFVQVEEENVKFNQQTEKAMIEARKGIGVVKTKSHSDLMKKLRE